MKKRPKNKRSSALKRSRNNKRISGTKFDQLEITAEESNFEGKIDFTEKDLTTGYTIDGVKIFKCFKLQTTADATNWLSCFVPIVNNALAEKNNIYVLLVIPFLSEMPVADAIAQNNPETTGIIQSGVYYEMTDVTFMQYKKAMKYLGWVPDTKEQYTEDLLRASVCKNGYYKPAEMYWWNGKAYHEGDLIWCTLWELTGDDAINIPDSSTYCNEVFIFCANFKAINEPILPIDISEARHVKIENGKRKLSNNELFDIRERHLDPESYAKILTRLTPAEKLWYYGKKKAKEEATIGFPIMCMNGNFYAPVEQFYDHENDELETFLVIFNAITCAPRHYDFKGVVSIDAGDIHIDLHIRPMPGRQILWNEIIKEYGCIDKRDYPENDAFDEPY
jgi:hypothetical protein